MTTYNLDDLAKALKSSLDKSRKKLDHMQAKRLASVINMDRSGQPESMSWECRLPAGDGSEFNFELLRLPWSSLNRTEMVDICSVSVEIDCDIQKSPGKPKEHRPEYDSYTATPIAGHKAGKKTHKITFGISQQNQEASVSIDGLIVEEFIDRQHAASQNETSRKKRHLKTSAIIIVSLLMAAAVAYLFLSPH